MEPSVDVFVPSRLYARLGWAALAGSLIGVLGAFLTTLAFIPALLFAAMAAVLFWLAARPPVRIGESQLNIGERAIAWREVRELNRIRWRSPLVMRLKLTNSRQKMLVYPGELPRVEQLLFHLRKNCQLATIDGVAYRDYWTWSSMSGQQGETPTADQPIRMLSAEDQQEIEQLYLKLKAVGRLDSRGKDTAKTPGED